jgi:NAD(P)-dependent dehydrogenase (short-subunit alcohol dehydrogenase family)
MALALLAAGHRVAVMARSKDAVDEFIGIVRARWGDERVLGITGSVRSASDCERAVAATVQRFGTVEGLLNNAGVHLPATADRPKFYELAEEQWRSIVDTHLNGSFLMARAVVPHLLARGWGRIVNHETSYDTMLRAGFTPYGAAKAGLEAATAGWAGELEGTGITVNAILPGGVANVPRITSEAFPDRSKLVQPELMGPPIVWLMSRASDGISGHRFSARLWNPDAPDEENIRIAGARAGWR